MFAQWYEKHARISEQPERMPDSVAQGLRCRGARLQGVVRARCARRLAQPRAATARSAWAVLR
eukprot:8064387-Lingulodinium_polyedra.AAC.1